MAILLKKRWVATSGASGSGRERRRAGSDAWLPGALLLVVLVEDRLRGPVLCSTLNVLRPSLARRVCLFASGQTRYPYLISAETSAPVKRPVGLCARAMATLLIASQRWVM